MKVHLYGVFNCTKPACVLFRQQRSGRIISMSSTSGLIGNSGQANYGAAKAGIAGFTRVIARDMGRYNVTCNSIAPGASTRMTMSEEVLAARQIRASKGVTGGGSAQSPVGAPALRDPDDIAPIVVYLATDAAANINGQTFGTSGGTISLYHNPEPMKSIHKDGRWTLDELDSIMPGTLLAGLVNPSPPQAPKQ
jgi:NAD(P)-dependent dehydrogenase (short-subunit alcohol dehydrogenase family)